MKMRFNNIKYGYPTLIWYQDRQKKIALHEMGRKCGYHTRGYSYLATPTKVVNFRMILLPAIAHLKAKMIIIFLRYSVSLL